MNNFEYIKTLSKDEMTEFIMESMSEAFNIIIDEMCNCWREEEAQATGLDMWREWLSADINDRSDKRMKLWKPNYGEEYYYVVVYNVTWSYFSGIGTRTSLSNDNIEVFPRTWLASDEDFQNLLSLNVFKTEEEAEKKLEEWQALIVENKGFLGKETL